MSDAKQEIAAVISQTVDAKENKADRKDEPIEIARQLEDEACKENNEYEVLTLYEGTLAYNEKTNRYQVKVGKTGNSKTVMVSKSQHGGSQERAFDAALALRNEMALKLGLVKTFRFYKRTPEISQYFAGFFDGDGCIQLVVKSGLRAEIFQSSVDDNPPPVLEWVVKYYGGKIHHRAERKTETSKNYWEWTAAGQIARRVLEDVSQFGIVKQPQADAVLKLVADVPRDNAQLKLGRDGAPEKIKKLIQKIRKNKNLPVDKSRLTNAYVAGLADAEGCVTLQAAHGMNERFTIAQKSFPNILKEIRAKYGKKSFFTQTDGEKICVGWCGIAASEVLEKIMPFLMVKRSQAEHATTYMEERRKQRPHGVNSPLSEAQKHKDAVAQLKCSRLKGHKRKLKITEKELGLPPLKKPRSAESESESSESGTE